MLVVGGRAVVRIWRDPEAPIPDTRGFLSERQYRQAAPFGLVVFTAVIAGPWVVAVIDSPAANWMVALTLVAGSGSWFAILLTGRPHRLIPPHLRPWKLRHTDDANEEWDRVGTLAAPITTVWDALGSRARPRRRVAAGPLLVWRGNDGILLSPDPDRSDVTIVRATLSRADAERRLVRLGIRVRLEPIGTEDDVQAGSS
ncbi:hypothetical protein [Patulibacter defluvii]|uniref:hypothetical protein n=1 Tax=Patulibacter defluvii TaxID=3095358 RepID=UPI002A760D27|nr:hypothetical protein [Patulibacter sp. DM4]